LTKDLKDRQKHINVVTKEKQALKTSPLSRIDRHPILPTFDTAVTKPKEMSLEFGNAYHEARLAWEEVEGIASSALEHAMGEDMTIECLVVTAEHCVGTGKMSNL
jgi:hypothetical protein